MAGVFVSYRREDAGMVAVDIARELERSLEIEVFFDLRSIEAGQRFRLEISEALKQSSVVIVLLGPGWAGSDRDGRRIDDEADVFRQEIETALESPATVIPVLVGDAAPPEAGDLPASLAPLVERNWHRIRLEAKWEAIMKLVDRVDETLEQHRWERIYGKGGPGGLKSYRADFDPRRETERASAGAGLYSQVLWPEDVVFRVNVALATERLLLVTGPDGSGRDSIAASIAANLGRRFYSFDYGADPSPGDLLYSMDDTARLADAQLGVRYDTGTYVNPGLFWWAFDPHSARRRGAADNVTPPLPLAVDPGVSPDEADSATPGAVIELSGDPPDNIRDYLRPLFSRRFTVPEISASVQAKHPILVVISTEELRPVDPWVRRRAVLCRMQIPDLHRLMDIVRHHSDVPPEIIEEVVYGFDRIRKASGSPDALDPRRVADALKAIESLGIEVGDASVNWHALLDALDPP